MSIYGDDVNIGSAVICDGTLVHPKKEKNSTVQKFYIGVHASILFYSILLHIVGILLHIVGSRQFESQQVTHGCAYTFQPSK